MSAAEILITGTRSGLGRYLHQRFGGLGWQRSTTAEQQARFAKSNFSSLIHCAFNAQPPATDQGLFDYISDNVLLTQELSRLPVRKLIFISTVDVYPKKPGAAAEDREIRLDEVQGIYGLTKLMSESIVRNHCPNHLILRCTTLLGKHSRRNGLIRMIEDEQCALTLSADSSFNYVRHEEVGDFISLALESEIQGTYNIASTGNVTLGEVAIRLDRQVKFGSFRYHAGQVVNAKAAALLPSLRRSSFDVADQFIRERRKVGLPGAHS